MEVYKKFFLFLGLTILLCLYASIVWSETMKDLIWRDGNYYKKFSDVPFNGKVNGDIKGLIKNGKKEGTWVRYYENGQLFSISIDLLFSETCEEMHLKLYLVASFLSLKLENSFAL